LRTARLSAYFGELREDALTLFADVEDEVLEEGRIELVLVDRRQGLARLQRIGRVRANDLFLPLSVLLLLGLGPLDSVASSLLGGEVVGEPAAAHEFEHVLEVVLAHGVGEPGNGDHRCIDGGAA
jgi:hypothetical protein